MKYAVVYASSTGNTKKIADAIAGAFSENECLYCGAPDVEKTKDADVIFVGFWTVRSTCSEDISNYLAQVHNKKIVLFGTCGFGGDESYYQRILEITKKNIGEDCTYIDGFMCQGKMPAAVRKKYESKMDEDPEKMQMMIDNFDRALVHPNEEDLSAAKAFAEKIKNL